MQRGRVVGLFTGGERRQGQGGARSRGCNKYEIWKTSQQICPISGRGEATRTGYLLWTQ